MGCEARRSGWVLIALLGACRAPEGNHSAQRCDAERPCPDPLVCYRSFCVEAEQGPEEQGDTPTNANEAGSAAASPGNDAAVAARADDVAVAPQDDAAPGVSRDDAAAVAPRDAAAVAPSPPSASADAGAGAPVTTDGAGPSQPDAVAEAAACLAQCTSAEPDSKECRKCEQKTFGVGPEELCEGDDEGEADDDDEAQAANPICTALCLTGELLGTGCQPSCSDSDCRSEP